MKITQFDRHTAKLLCEAIEKTLAPLAEQYGLSVKTNGGTFAEHNYHPRIEFAVLDANGEARTREAEDFRRLAAFYGFNAEDLGRTFEANRRQYTITGMATKSTRFPVLARRDDGKTFKFPAGDVRRKLGYPPVTPIVRDFVPRDHKEIA